MVSLSGFCDGMFLKPDLAALLPHYDPPVSLENPDNMIVRQTGNNGHTASSTISEFSVKTWSSSTDSR